MGSATIQDLRQLPDYYVEQKDKEKRSVKGIFIINHYRNQAPPNRKNPATQDAMDLIEKYGFNILTTTELYNLLVQHWEKTITKEEILRKLG